VTCKAQQSPVAKAVAAATALPALLAAHPAFALVDDRLGGEGTGKVLGVSGGEGWAIIGAFATIWAIFYASTRELGGDQGDDSGLSL
jgi:photosystem II PsbW protein